MKKIILFILLALFVAPMALKAQSFYVSAKDNKSREIIMEKIRFEGFTIAGDSTKSDYTIQFTVEGKYKAVSMKRPYKGYIKIHNTGNGQEVTATGYQKAYPSIYNGYNAAPAIARKICDRNLVAALKKCK